MGNSERQSPTSCISHPGDTGFTSCLAVASENWTPAPMLVLSREEVALAIRSNRHHVLLALRICMIRDCIPLPAGQTLEHTVRHHQHPSL